MLSTRILLRKDRENGTGKCPLTIRITKSRKSSYLSTGIKLFPNEWDHQRQKIKSNYENHVRANELIKSIKAEAESIAFEFEINKVNYSVQMIKDMIVNKEANKDVILFAANWIKERYNRKEITYSTVRRYEAVLEKVSEFTNGIFKIRDFNHEFLSKFQLYLQEKKNNSINTIASNFSFLRSVANALIKKDLLKINDYPFKKWKITKEESDRKYVSLEGIKMIRELHLPEGSKIKLCRDIFLFCNQTGLRVGDGLRLRKKNFLGKSIHIRRQKTRDVVTLPLTQKAIDIVHVYLKDKMEQEDYVFGFLTHEMQMSDEQGLAQHKSATALINKNLKIICKRLGFDFTASTHYARHSMATNALAAGLSMEEIQAILGHKDIRTTHIYAKAHSKMLENAVAKLDA